MTMEEGLCDPGPSKAGLGPGPKEGALGPQARKGLRDPGPRSLEGLHWPIPHGLGTRSQDLQALDLYAF